MRPLILQGCWTSPRTLGWLEVHGEARGRQKSGGSQTFWKMPKGSGLIQGGHQGDPAGALAAPLPSAKQKPVQWAAPRGPASSPRWLGWSCTSVGFGALYRAGRHRQHCLQKCKISTSEEHVCRANKEKLQSDSWNSHMNQKKKKPMGLWNSNWYFEVSFTQSGWVVVGWAPFTHGCRTFMGCRLVLYVFP